MSTSPDLSSLSPSDWEALSAYFTGALSDVERAVLERRMAEDRELAATVARLRRALAASEPALDRSRSEAALQRLRREMVWRSGAAQRSMSRERSPGSRTFGEQHPRWAMQRVGRLLPWVAVAAVIAVVLLTRGRVNHTVRPMDTIYATNSGERANITLADGSHVALGVASRLIVPEDFARGNRTLRLTGEALFAVAHRGGAPFTVAAGGTSARVLGTSFLVRHYEGDTSTVVAVREGKVGVRSVVLAAMQQGVITPLGTVHVLPATGDQFAFATGVLVLPYLTLAEAIPALERWYDARIRLEDPTLGRLMIRGRFVAGSRADLASILELTLGVHVVHDGDVLSLYPRR